MWRVSRIDDGKVWLVEGKDSRVNIGKTKGVQLLEGKIDPCSICGERLGSNSAKYLQCLKWVHCFHLKMDPFLLKDQ